MWPKGANLEVCDGKFGGLDEMRGKYVKDSEMYGQYNPLTPQLHFPSSQVSNPFLPFRGWKLTRGSCSLAGDESDVSAQGIGF